MSIPVEDRRVEELSVIGDSKPIGIHHERAQMLADLRDPDEGKSDEERASIVTYPLFINHFILSSTDLAPIGSQTTLEG